MRLFNPFCNKPVAKTRAKRLRNRRPPHSVELLEGRQLMCVCTMHDSESGVFEADRAEDHSDAAFVDELKLTEDTGSSKAGLGDGTQKTLELLKNELRQLLGSEARTIEQLEWMKENGTIAGGLFQDEGQDALTDRTTVGKREGPPPPWANNTTDPYEALLGLFEQHLSESGSSRPEGSDRFSRLEWAGDETTPISTRNRDGTEERMIHTRNDDGTNTYTTIEIHDDGTREQRSVTRDSDGSWWTTRTTERRYVRLEENGVGLGARETRDKDGVVHIDVVFFRIGEDGTTESIEFEEYLSERPQQGEGDNQDDSSDDDSDSQPNERDGSGWFSPLGSDPWAAYFAWYSSRPDSDPLNRDAFMRPSEGDDGAPGGSGTPHDSGSRVGPSAVTNTGTGDFVVGRTGSGGSSDGPYDPRDPFPIGPA